MKGKDMYWLMMLTDMVLTAAIEAFIDSGVNPDNITKEMWLESSKEHVARRKAAMERIKAHGKEV